MLLLLPDNSGKAGKMLSMAGGSRGMWNTTERGRQNQQLKMEVRRCTNNRHPDRTALCLLLM